MKILEFECDDRYEAEKLSSLMSVQKDNTVWISGVVAAVDNEIVMQLKDWSSHSIVLKDEETVVRLKSFVMDVIKGKRRIHSSDFVESVARIIIID
jgi:hypothetical protein